MSRQPVPGKRRADPSTRRRRRGEPKPTGGGKRAYRPENDEGLTPEFLEQLRREEAADSLWEPAATGTGQFAGTARGPGGRAVLAGIDAELRADRLYQEALARLAHG
jgi:hypothetical protein